jgi:hypothetical protein
MFWIRMFLGLLDPGPYFRKDPNPSINKQKKKKNIDLCCFVLLDDMLSLWTDETIPTKIRGKKIGEKN